MAKKSIPKMKLMSATVPNRASDSRRKPSPDGLAYTAFPSGLGMDWKSGKVHEGKIGKA
jgi:hypothetical protein